MSPSICCSFAVNGVSIYDAVDADGEDAYVTEGRTLDGCGAHTDMQFRYFCNLTFLKAMDG